MEGGRAGAEALWLGEGVHVCAGAVFMCVCEHGGGVRLSTGPTCS